MKKRMKKMATIGLSVAIILSFSFGLALPYQENAYAAEISEEQVVEQPDAGEEESQNEEKDSIDAISENDITEENFDFAEEDNGGKASEGIDFSIEDINVEYNEPEDNQNNEENALENFQTEKKIDEISSDLIYSSEEASKLEASDVAKLKVYASTKNRNQHNFSQFVTKNGNEGCMCVAYAIGYSIVDKKDYSPTYFSHYGGPDAWDPAGKAKSSWESYNAKTLYSLISARRPVLVHLGNTHWVTVIGYKNSINPSNPSNGDFIAIDPSNGKELPLTSCYGKTPDHMTPFYGTGEWESAPFVVPTGTQIISDGDYHIVSKLDQNFGLNVSYNSTENSKTIQIHNSMQETDTSSIVTVKHIGNGYYKLIMKNSGKAVDVHDSGTAAGTNVVQYTDHGKDNQQWVIKSTGDGWFNIISKCNGLYLDVSGGKANDYTNVQVWTGNGTDAQKWKFVASGLSTGQTIADGDYSIISAADHTYGADIAGGSLDNRGNLILYSHKYENNPNQIFTFKYLGNGYYSIMSKNSGKMLDAEGAGNLSHTNISQYDANGSDAQKWIVKNAGNGFYYLVNKASGLYLDLSGGKAANSTNIQLYLNNWSVAQKWALVREKGNKIDFDLQGGTVDGAFKTYTASSINGGRGSGQLVVYNISNMIVDTNQYGIEAAIDAKGYVSAIRAYNSTTKLNVPSGGIVVSGHVAAGTNGASFTGSLKTGDYVGYDPSTLCVSAYHDSDSYMIDNKYVENGSVYGTLPTPKKNGYYFDGWYTQANGGERVTYNTTYTTNKLYAHWTEKEKAAPVQSTAYNGHYYEVYDISMGWTEAKELCESKGGYLTCITSKEENEEITKLIQNGARNIYYIGATDEVTEGVWKWQNGEEFQYNNWDPQVPEPNDGTEGNYAAMIAVDNPPAKQPGEWIDTADKYPYPNYYCYTNSGFVCEYDTPYPMHIHKAVTKPAVDPTCTQTGLSKGSYCPVCGETIVPQEIIPALGHDYGQWTVIKTATREETGLESRTCKHDKSHVEYRTIPVIQGADTDFNGLAEKNGEWYYYQNGKFATAYTGMYKAVSIGWVYINSGRWDTSYTGMAKNAYGWWYMKNGKLDTTYTGMAKNAYGWWYMKNGKLDTTFTGLANNAYGTWYMKNGKLDTTVTDMYKDASRGWVYLNKGKWDIFYTDVVKKENGQWYMVNGKLDTSLTGMYRAKSQGWIYVSKGKWDTSYTGMAKNDYGWWYMKNGKLDQTYTGMAKNAYGWWYMKNGKLDTTFTGIAQNEYGSWYMVKGKLASSYNGKVTYNSKTYTVKNGKATKV